MKRLLNLSCGMTAGDDRSVPRRVLREPFAAGESARHLPDLGVMLAEYYRARGWDEAGVPTPAKLEELGLGNQAGRLAPALVVADSVHPRNLLDAICEGCQAIQSAEEATKCGEGGEDSCAEGLV